MEVLIQGLEFTNQLHLHLLQNKNNFLFGDEDFKESALDLTTKIHQSFTSALSLLNTCSANNSVDDGTSCDELFIDYEILSSSPVMTTGMSSDDHHWKNTDQYFGESKNKAIPGSSANRDDLKVGCKRRKQSNSTHTWVRVTPTAIDDGHAWRKYGQKPIYNTKFPRSYYRCTHRKEQGCQATKHVQKTQDKPSMFQTTYLGHHICKESASIMNPNPDLMLDENTDPSVHSSCVINFQTNLAIKQPFTFPSSSFNTSVTEHEHNTTSHDQCITPSDHDLTILLADLMAFESISREVHEVLGV